MVYNTQNYWVFGLRPSSGILKTREPNVLETGSVSVLTGEWETPILLGPLGGAYLNRICSLEYRTTNKVERHSNSEHFTVAASVY
jgi:hypothetical protein